MRINHLRRREFITLLGGAATAWPFAARAQQPTPTVPQVRVGVLTASPPTRAMLNAFREGMRERGYIEGQNLSIEVRWPQGTFEVLQPNSLTPMLRSSSHGPHLR
jgi:putative tryptophan/tyrosine transport system substrate-binding protein